MSTINIQKQFVRYVSQNMLGMLGMSLYILADTFFISKSVGANGITALNLVLPLYNLIFAIGAMIGVGSAIRFTVERNKGIKEAEGYFFHALAWGAIISLIFILAGACFPGQVIHALGGDTDIVNTGFSYTRIFLMFAPFLCGTISSQHLSEMTEIRPLPCSQRLEAICLTSSLTMS